MKHNAPNDPQNFQSEIRFTWWAGACSHDSPLNWPFYYNSRAPPSFPDYYTSPPGRLDCYTDFQDAQPSSETAASPGSISFWA